MATWLANIFGNGKALITGFKIFKPPAAQSPSNRLPHRRHLERRQGRHVPQRGAEGGGAQWQADAGRRWDGIAREPAARNEMCVDDDSVEKQEKFGFDIRMIFSTMNHEQEGQELGHVLLMQKGTCILNMVRF